MWAQVLRRLVKERREIGEVEDAKTMAERLEEIDLQKLERSRNELGGFRWRPPSFEPTWRSLRPFDLSSRM